MNEAKGKDTYANTDLFKTRITDDTREVELKNKDTVQIKNYAGYVVNTNNLNSVNAGDRDRRFCVLDCNNIRLHDKIYFKEYVRTVNDNPEAIRCIYEYLKTFDIEKIVPGYIFSDSRPKTELYDDLVQSNREKEWDFLNELVFEKIQEETVEITTKHLWSEFKKFCVKNHYNISNLPSRRFFYIFNRTIVSTLNRKNDYIDSIMKSRDNSNRGYIFNGKKLSKYFGIISE